MKGIRASRLARTVPSTVPLKLYTLGDVNRNINQPCQTITQTNKISALQFLKKLRSYTQKQGYCSLSSNQLGNGMFRMFVCLNKKCLIPQQWFGYKQELNDYDCVINPELIETSTLEEYAYEQCPSIAGYRMKVKRPVFGRFKWQDENFKEKDQVFKGFQLRVWLHQFTHMQGHLVIENQICNGQIDLIQEAKTLENQQALLALRDYYKMLRQQLQDPSKKSKSAKVNSSKEFPK